MTRIGLISDTHGLMRPEALVALAGVSHIVHAGDIGSEQILSQLQAIAPVTAVRGNNDKEPWARSIAETEVLEIAGKRIYVLHDLKELDLEPAAAGFAVVVAGHSHKPAVIRKGDVLYVNPGSAGPRRFNLPISVGLLEIDGGEVRAEIRELTL
ncbi:MAG: metallophosphoesterase family protein [Gammaproteobacteria bacterium]